MSFSHPSPISLSICMVSVAAVLFSLDSALATDDAPGLSMGPRWTDPHTLSPVLVDFYRNGNLIYAGRMSTSQGFLDLKPRASVNLFKATKEVSIKTLSHPSVGNG